MNKRVVITGMGSVTPIGNDVESFWDSLKAGKIGIGPITHFDPTPYKVQIAAEVKDFPTEKYFDKKEARRMDLFCKYAMAATEQAVQQAGIDFNEIDTDKAGVIIGSGIGGIDTIYQTSLELEKRGAAGVSPFFIPIIISNMASGNVSIKYGLKGYNNCAVTACATGTHSIGDAYRVIKHGYANVMVAGGTEAATSPLALAGFINITALTKETDPAKASIPFDKNRSGFVLGEGAGVVIMEEYEHAVKRGANILAEIVGYGATADAYHMTAPHSEGDGATRSMKEAMEDAGITPEQVSYINAHGTSTPPNDKIETLAIKKAFGEAAYTVQISSTKSMTGHLLGAAGGIEAVVCIKSLTDQFIPATMGYTTPDEECDLDYVPNIGRETRVEYAMSNTFGFGGHNATLIFKKY